MQNLGVEPASDSEKTESVQVTYGAAKAAETAADERLNVVFFLDARGWVPATEFEGLRNLIRDTAHEVLSGYMHRVNLSIMVNRGGAEVSEIPLNDRDSLSRIDDITNLVAPRDDRGEDIVITSCFDTMYEAYKDKTKDTLFILFVTDNMIMANAADSPKVYQKLAKSEKIHISLVSDTRSTDVGSYVIDIIKETNGQIIKSDMASVKEYITGYLPNTYSIITANDYEPVVLKDILKKNSKTDTDDDQLSDWNEVNIDAIYKVKESLPADQGGDKDIRKKSYLLMDDMPTIQQCITYYGEDHLYVESGFERFKNSKRPPGMPPSAFEKYFFNTVLNKYHITPIYSDPTQVDSDGDGNSDYDEVKIFSTSPLISNPLIFEKYNYDENGILKEDGEFPLLWCISDNYFINGSFLSEAEIIGILEKRGVDKEKAKILYDKCSSFKHDPDILFGNDKMYSSHMYEILSKWTKSNKFDQRVGINPAIILGTWKWEAGYGLNNSFGSYYGAPDDFEQQLTICIARYLRDFYYYQYNLIEDDKKSELPMMYGTEKQFPLIPCNAAMYSRAQYNPSNMNELKLWHDTIFYEDW